MNFKTVYRILIVGIFLVLFFSINRYINSIFIPPFDTYDTCSHIIDGDTFDIASGYRIRLADVDTPENGEYGYQEASDYLESKIYGKPVYLDLDDVNLCDTTGTRLVAVVYVEYEPGCYLNLNKALLDQNLAVISDFPNDFNPALWDTRIYDLNTQSKLVIIGASFVASLIIVYYINRMKNQLTNYVVNIKERFRNNSNEND